MSAGSERGAVGGSAALGGRPEAERLVAGIRATMDALCAVLEAETAHLVAGRIRQGLAEADRKGAIAAEYLRGLEAAKANAVALKRHVPDLLPALKRSQETLRDATLRNQTVLTTARAVSEGLVKAVADEVARTARPQGYAPARPGAMPPPRAASAGPIAFSGRF